MTTNKKFDEFLSNYNEDIFINALKLREVLFANLPGIIEQIDIPPK
jgi:hypothetical protein